MAQDWRDEWADVLRKAQKPADPPPERWGADAVERGLIRRYLEPLEFDCPLHYDEKVARRHGFRDIIAPYTSLGTFAAQPFWSPGETAFPSENRNAQPQRLVIEPQDYPKKATGLFATDMEIEFVRPVVIGERVGGRNRGIVDVSLKETRVGRGAFIKVENGYVDADGNEIATMRTGLYVYEPLERRADEAPSRPPDTDWTSGPPAKPLDRQRTADDVRLGELLEEVRFPLPVLRLVVAAGANRDFNLIHHNTEFAQASGAPEMYANTLFLQSMWEVLVRGYIGCAGTIKKIAGFRMGSFNCAGDTVTVKGRVEKLVEADGEAIVDIRVWSENARGVSVGPGIVKVGIPLSANSSAV